MVVIPEPNSFVTLQAVMTIESYFMYFYSAYLISLQFFKQMGGLRYPPHIWGMEFAAIIFFMLLQAQRINLGMSANRNENYNALFIFWAFTILTLLMYVYFSTYTTYVLTIDVAVGTVGIVLTGLQVILGLFASLYIRNKTMIL